MNYLNKFFLITVLFSFSFGFAMQQEVILNAAILAQIRYQELRDAGIIIEPGIDHSARVYSKKRQPDYETKKRNQPHATKNRLFSQHHK